jgi:hypothetical protein
MSVYQNTYFIVPRKGNYTLFEGLNLNSFMEEEGFFEDDLFWENLNCEYEDIESYLLKKFKVGKSWSKDLKIFGDIDVNSLEILLESNSIVSLSFRVNFKTDYRSFLNEVIDFCKLNDYLVVDNELNALSLDFETINENIHSSKAYKKCSDFFGNDTD